MTSRRRQEIWLVCCAWMALVANQSWAAAPEAWVMEQDCRFVTDFAQTRFIHWRTIKIVSRLDVGGKLGLRKRTLSIGETKTGRIMSAPSNMVF